MPLTQTAERRIPAVEVLEPRARDSWTHTRNGDPRGYIDSDKLKELWIHTGTACNLACPFCLEGSHPGDGRIPGMKLSDVKPFIHEALDMGVEQFSFTGGEPFVIKDFINILDYASQHRPCFVLTNATDPLLIRCCRYWTTPTRSIFASAWTSLTGPGMTWTGVKAVSIRHWRVFAGWSTRVFRYRLLARPIRRRFRQMWKRLSARF